MLRASGTAFGDGFATFGHYFGNGMYRQMSLALRINDDNF